MFFVLSSSPKLGAVDASILQLGTKGHRQRFVLQHGWGGVVENLSTCQGTSYLQSVRIATTFCRASTVEKFSEGPLEFSLKLAAGLNCSEGRSIIRPLQFVYLPMHLSEKQKQKYLSGLVAS